MQVSGENRYFYVSLYAVFLALGISLSVFESLYLPPLVIPGAKLGLANIVTLISLLFFKGRDVLSNTLLRVVFAAFLTGTFFTTIFIFSITAALISSLLVISMYKRLYGTISFIGLSVIGAVSHNITQLYVAKLFIGTNAVFVHLPLLLLAGTLTGMLNGMIVNMIAGREDIKWLVFSNMNQDS